MPGYSGQPGRQRDPRTQTLMLLVAGLWLLILLTCVVGLRPVAAAALGPSFPLTATTAPVATTTTPTNTPAGPAATATSPGQKPTATRTVAPTATGAAGATATTAPVDNGGGGGGGFQGSGPQPTRVVLAQPTAGAGGDGGLQGLSPAAFGSNGLLVATTLSCVIGILGLVIAFIALTVLLRNGYGPFLRALLLGKRAGRRSASAVSPAGVGSGGRVRPSTSWDNEDAGRDYRGDGNRGEQRRSPPVPARAPQRQAPVSRSRANWR